MKQRIYLGKVALLILIVGPIIFFILGVISFSIEGFNEFSLIYAVFGMLLSLIAFIPISCFFGLFMFLEIDDEGIRNTVRNRVLKDIRWNEVREIKVVENVKEISSFKNSLIITKDKIYDTLEQNLKLNICISKKQVKSHALIIPYLDKIKAYEDNKEQIDIFFGTKNK